MKTKISLIIVLVFGVCLVARGQVQPKDLPEATSLNDADIMITQQESDDKVRKFDFQFFKDQVLYWQTNGNFAYTFDSIAIGKSTPGEFLDVDGNIKADTIKGYINVKGNNDKKIAYFDADSVLTSVDELSYDGSVLEFDTETFFYTKASLYEKLYQNLHYLFSLLTWLNYAL